MAGRWTALVPLKPARLRKSRLAAELSDEQRITLSERMAAHVVAVLGAHPLVEAIVLLASDEPPGWPHHWIRDHGRGLNAELEAARAGLMVERLLILHADLPELGSRDLDMLLAHDRAIAPDRHGTGTNAITLPRNAVLHLCFGPGSFARHRLQCAGMAIVDRPGLANDVDLPEDLPASCYSSFSGRM